MAQPEPQAIHASQHESVPEAGEASDRSDYGFSIIPVDLKDARLYFPFAYWFPEYINSKATLARFVANDILAGITVGVMVIPQGMAYALLAGFPPVMGLYTSMWGCIVYAFFGTSGQVAVGPTAIMSLLTLEALHSAGLHEGTPEYLAAAGLLCFEIGIFSCLLGFMKAGVLSQLLSHAVIVGFTAAAAFIIGMSQMRHVFGIEYISGEFFVMIIDFFRHIHETNGMTLILSVVVIAILVFFKVWKKKTSWPGSAQVKFVPAALIIVILSIAVTVLLGDNAKWAIIGDIQPGVPTVTNFLANSSMSNAISFMPTAAIISLLSFIETFAVGGKFASMKGYSMNGSQELIALGMCNFIAGWFQSFPLSGSLSRTAVAYSANSVSPLYSIVVSLFLIVTLLALTPLFYYLPRACLGSIVVVAVVNLLDVHAFKFMWRVKRADFGVAVFTFGLTLLFGVEVGVLVGVAASMMVFLKAAVKPNYDILGRVSDTNVYRPIQHVGGAEIRDDVLVMSWDAPIFFGNVSKFKERVIKHVRRKFIDSYADGIRSSIAPGVQSQLVQQNTKLIRSSTVDESDIVVVVSPKHPTVQHPSALVFDFVAVNDIDSAATEALHPFFESVVSTYGVTVFFAHVKEHVKEVMISGGLDTNATHFVDSVRYAVECWDKQRVELVRKLPSKFHRHIFSDAEPFNEASDEDPTLELLARSRSCSRATVSIEMDIVQVK